MLRRRRTHFHSAHLSRLSKVEVLVSKAAEAEILALLREVRSGMVFALMASERLASGEVALMAGFQYRSKAIGALTQFLSTEMSFVLSSEWHGSSKPLILDYVPNDCCFVVNEARSNDLVGLSTIEAVLF
jgi:hypothetical protein